MTTDGDQVFDQANVSRLAHEPVLTRQVLELLNPGAGMVCLDCTVGLGGHGKQIADRLAPGGRYVGLDVDPKNITAAGQHLSDAPVPVQLLHGNFASAREALNSIGLEQVDLLLADLGFASNQMDDPERGFSFNAQGPLDMRLDPGLPNTAADLVNRFPENELADLIYHNGEEQLSRKIARKIVEYRSQSPINTTSVLAKLVRDAYRQTGRRGGGRRHQRIDPATRTFMALRIAVNAELSALERLLSELPNLLSEGAVAAIISFHSLEDRLVKRAFAELCRAKRAQALTKKPTVADPDQCRANPRSRSAKLRAIRWIGASAQKQMGC